MLSQRIKTNFYNGGCYIKRKKNLDGAITVELSTLFDTDYGTTSHHIIVWDMVKIAIITKLEFYGDNAVQESLQFWNDWMNEISPDGSFLIENRVR